MTKGIYSARGAGMDQRYQVKQYVAIVRSSTGQRFQVFITGDPKWYLFVPMIGETSCVGSIQFPVEKSNLRDNIRKMLAHGCGNSL